MHVDVGCVVRWSPNIKNLSRFVKDLCNIYDCLGPHFKTDLGILKHKKCTNMTIIVWQFLVSTYGGQGDRTDTLVSLNTHRNACLSDLRHVKVYAKTRTHIGCMEDVQQICARVLYTCYNQLPKPEISKIQPDIFCGSTARFRSPTENK